MTKQPIIALAALSASAVAGLAFALSFVALRDVAIAIRVPAQLAWAWPVALDGAVVVATLTAFAVRRDRSRAVRLYPWAVLLAFSGISLAANALHATGTQLPAAAAAWLGAVAPAALLASVHLVVICVDHTPAPKPRTPRVPAIAAAAAPQPTTHAAPAARSDKAAVRARVVAHRDAHGEWPSAAVVGGWLGQSQKSGQRFVAALRAEGS